MNDIESTRSLLASPYVSQSDPYVLQVNPYETLMRLIKTRNRMK